MGHSLGRVLTWRSFEALDLAVKGTDSGFEAQASDSIQHRSLFLRQKLQNKISLQTLHLSFSLQK